MFLDIHFWLRNELIWVAGVEVGGAKLILILNFAN